ncbi:MAG: TIGR02466 family protein, partial [Opitutaceae bacterium]
MIRAWFPTLIYSEPLTLSGLGRFNAELAKECRALRDFDRAGREWSRTNYPGGYTSYASLNELHRFSSTFALLERRITRHVRRFARALELDLRGSEIR